MRSAGRSGRAAASAARHSSVTVVPETTVRPNTVWSGSQSAVARDHSLRKVQRVSSADWSWMPSNGCAARSKRAGPPAVVSGSVQWRCGSQA